MWGLLFGVFAGFLPYGSFYLRLGEPWFLVYTNFLLPQTHASSGVG